MGPQSAPQLLHGRIRNRPEFVVELADPAKLLGDLQRADRIGQLPQFNIGTHDGRSCDASLTAVLESTCAASDFTHVVNGRFKGGYITRSLGDPSRGLHVVQMELSCRGYLREPEAPVTEADWPVPFDPDFAAPLQQVLRRMLQQCIDFAAHSP